MLTAILNTCLSVQRYYIPAYRQLRRLESVTRSPVFARFSETLLGPSTVRAFGEQRRFIKEFQECNDHTMAFTYAGIVAARLGDIRNNFIASFAEEREDHAM